MSENPFQITFTLKQHTPIIHFQHEQAGATLRATELKPKLDRWIIQQIGEANIPDTWKGTWRKGHHSLEYKVTIGPTKSRAWDIQRIVFDKDSGEVKRNDNNKILVQAYPGYFGNSGKDDKSEMKRTIWTNTPIVVEVFCLSSSLRELIERTFADFIFSTNFGTRQTKGFGSFSCTSHPHTAPPNCFFDIHNPQNRNLFDFDYVEKEVFARIELLYKALRSGINYPRNPKDRDARCKHDSRFYFKSILWAYAKSNAIQWEKKTIKEAMLRSTTCFASQKVANNNRVDNPFGFAAIENRLMKAMLGLSTDEQWLTYGVSLQIESELKDRDRVSPLYARFKSPITFKPIVLGDNFYRVYIIAEQPLPEMYGKWFEVQSNRGGVVRIQTPHDSKEFDTNGFLSFAFFDKLPSGKYVMDLPSHVGNRAMENTFEFRMITEIFKSIRGEK